MHGAVVTFLILASLIAAAPAAHAEFEAPEEPVPTTLLDSDCGDATRETGHEITGGCPLHATAHVVRFDIHSFLGEHFVIQCGSEFTARVGDDGEGWIPLGALAFASNSESSTDCEQGTAFTPCDEKTAGDEDHPGDWHLQAFEDEHDGSLWIQLKPCVLAVGGGGITGDIWLRVSIDPATGNPASLEANQHALDEAHGATDSLEFSGHWDIEGLPTEAPSEPVAVEATNEVTGNHCTGVTVGRGHAVSGGCVLHFEADSVSAISHTIFGELGWTCAIELTAHFGEDGEGWIGLGEVAITHSTEGSSPCGEGEAANAFDVCSESHAGGESHPGDWHVQLVEDSADGSVWMDLEPCFEGAPTVVTGDVWIRVEQDFNGHVVGLTAAEHLLSETHGTNAFAISGTWGLEEGELELLH